MFQFYQVVITKEELIQLANVIVRDTNTRITVVPLNAEVNRGDSTDFRIIANSKNLSASGSISVKLGIEASPSSIYNGTSSRTESITVRNGRVTKDITIATTSDNNTDFELDGLLKVLCEESRWYIGRIVFFT